MVCDSVTAVTAVTELELATDDCPIQPLKIDQRLAIRGAGIVLQIVNNSQWQ